MRTIIIEDEPLAAQYLQFLLKDICGDIIVDTCLAGVREAVDWIRTRPVPDFYLIDIQLKDGTAFDIFENVEIKQPVIFTTASHCHALQSFRVFCIDYLLKPIKREELERALEKINRYYSASVQEIGPLLNKLNLPDRAYKTRLMGRTGQRSVLIDCLDIAFFQADNKIVHLVTFEGCRYLIDHTLEQLQQILDPRKFFRANRSILVQVGAVRQIRSHVNSRLRLSLLYGKETADVIVSRDRVGAFRQWANP